MVDRIQVEFPETTRAYAKVSRKIMMICVMDGQFHKKNEFELQGSFALDQDQAQRMADFLNILACECQQRRGGKALTMDVESCSGSSPVDEEPNLRFAPEELPDEPVG